MVVCQKRQRSSELAFSILGEGGLNGLPLRVSDEGLLRSSQQHHAFSPKGVAGLPFTARIGRAHSDRARSASKKDGPATPFLSFRDRALHAHRRPSSPPVVFGRYGNFGT